MTSPCPKIFLFCLLWILGGFCAWAAQPSLDIKELAGEIRVGDFSINPSAPPLGLKTYLDLRILVDETILARDATKGDALSTRKPVKADAQGEFIFPLFHPDNLLKLMPEERGKHLFCSFSKDGGKTWSEARFVFALANKERQAVIKDMELRKLPGHTLHISFDNNLGEKIAVTFKGNDLARLATMGDLQRAPKGKFLLYSGQALEDELKAGVSELLCVGGDVLVPASRSPQGYRVDRDLGLFVHESIEGQVLHFARGRSILESRAVVTPKGDYIVMIPDGQHASSPRENVNVLLAYRSSDKGRTWAGPYEPFGEKEKHHAVLPIVPRNGGGQIYLLETLYGAEYKGMTSRNRVFGYRYSDDDGKSWSKPDRIRLADGGAYGGVGVIQATETDAGTWMAGFHGAQMLRGALDGQGGRSWSVVMPELTTSPLPAAYRMDELRVIRAEGPKVLSFARTQEGHLWKMRSADDGKTWNNPEPTPLVQPDAPPMMFYLSDGKTMLALHHNRAVMRSVHEPRHSKKWTMPMPSQEDIAFGDKYRSSYHDWVSRGEVWVSLSSDGGESWSEPRFLFSNALEEMPDGANPSYNCSYIDMFADGGDIHLIVPHRWRRVTYLRFPESAIRKLLTKEALSRANDANHDIFKVK